MFAGRDPPPAIPPLLSALGLPIARHLPAWLEKCVLAHTPGATRLSPALARAHLAASLNRHQPPATAGADGGQPPPTAGLAQALLAADKLLPGATDVPPASPSLLADAASEGAAKGSVEGAAWPGRAASALLAYCLSDLGLTTLDAGGGGSAAAATAREAGKAGGRGQPPPPQQQAAQARQGAEGSRLPLLSSWVACLCLAF